jgi:hypothetical protein
MNASPQNRPRIVDVAFWCWIVAALLLIVGGLITASVSIAGFPLVVRVAGVLSVVIGAAVAFLAGRSRNGDVRFRRALIALTLALIVVIGLGSALGLLVVHILTLVALLPLIAGMVCITRPDAAAWFATPQEQTDGG